MTVVKSESKGFVQDLNSSRKEESLFKIKSESIEGFEE